MRIAMWSGPRNISTAMMRSWENRPDTEVVDEPFYAYYLKHSGIQHPMQEAVIASQPNDWQDVVKESLSQPLSAENEIQYQKHMTQHMIMDFDDPFFIDWFTALKHVFLIRHPASVVASYAKKRTLVNASDVGFKQQFKLFELARGLGLAPPVIDAKSVLIEPRLTLSRLCNELAIRFDETMLAWPAGHRDSDGVWATHWYQNVEKSTGFHSYQQPTIKLSQQQQAVVDECLPHYSAMVNFVST